MCCSINLDILGEGNNIINAITCKCIYRVGKKSIKTLKAHKKWKNNRKEENNSKTAYRQH